MLIGVDRKDAQALQRALRRLGPAARRVQRRAVGAAGKALVRHMREAADNAGFVNPTGATRRSIGIVRLRDGTLKIGVRYNWQDKKTGKIPNKYAAKVDRQKPWFDAVQRQHGPGIAKEIHDNVFREIRKEYKK